LTAKTHSLLIIWAARRIIEKGVCVNCVGILAVGCHVRATGGQRNLPFNLPEVCDWQSSQSWYVLANLREVSRAQPMRLCPSGTPRWFARDIGRRMSFRGALATRNPYDDSYLLAVA